MAAKMSPEEIEKLKEQQLHPELYMKGTNIDRHYCKRVVPMKVLSLGFSKAGTSSMKAAYEILGYDDVYHMAETFVNVQDCDMWIEAYNAKYRGKGKPYGRAEFDKLLGHCEVVTDAPSYGFAEELIEAYPEAKVVLVGRDIDSWYKSISELIESNFWVSFKVLAFFDPWFSGRLRPVFMGNMIVLGGTDKSAEECKAGAKRRYREHYALVRRVTPKERLLEYKLGSGWEPLCKFLGKPVPDAEFPHLNEKKLFIKLMNNVVGILMKRAAFNAAVVLSGLSAVGYGVYWAIINRG